MRKEDLVINTLVYLEQIKEGKLQEELLEPLNSIGIANVEIRREFICDFTKELLNIREKATKYKMNIYYSIPELLYKDGYLLEEDFKKYLLEAKTMGAKQIKLCIGDYQKVENGHILKINQLCEEYNIVLTVENDQTEDNGKSEKIYIFLKESRSIGGKILATFDIGNWVWQQEKPLNNAKLLNSFVTYIHLKDVKGGSNPKTTLLDEGEINWREVLKELPQVPVALEYSCGTNPTKQLELELTKLENV